MRVLFICHANICRSFLAQEFLKSMLPQISIFSRGLYANPGFVVPAKVQQALLTRHLPVPQHQATALTANDLAQADLIFCMERAHEERLLDCYPQYTDKIWLLPLFALGQQADITDPISLEGRAFEKQIDFLYKVVEAASKRLDLPNKEQP